MTTSRFNLMEVRSEFPALSRRENGHQVAYLDGPGGTQVPNSVIEAMATSLQRGVSNLGGAFGASHDAETITRNARTAMADFLGAKPEEVSFGQNMTSLTFALSRAIARTWNPGESIVVTSLDHDSNYTPWVMAAEDRGVEVRVAEFDTADGALDPSTVVDLIDSTTRLVAVPMVSNALGTVVDVGSISRGAHEHEALVFVDAVHAGPHIRISIDTIQCDFLAVSAYKFFGPHTGILYGRSDHMTSLDAYKVRPAPSKPPGKWETGTQSFESLAGVAAAVDHIADLGTGDTRAGRLDDAFALMATHGHQVADRFIKGIDDLPRVRIVGVPKAGPGRVPTFGVEVEGAEAAQVASHLSDRGIYVWAGHYYAVNVMDRLGVLDSGGLTRIGFVHYNTVGEADRVLEALDHFG